MKSLYRAFLGIGMLMLIGTAGSSDLGVITTVQENWQIVIGLLLTVIGFSKGEVTEWRK